MFDDRMREGKEEGYGSRKEATVTMEKVKREDGWKRSKMCVCR